MLNDLLKSIDKIYIAFGATDFRKQIPALLQLVQDEYKKNPYEKCAYIFFNKKKTSIKILTYDRNGFILAQKVLLNVDKMRFKWPRNEGEMKNITKTQLEWLLSGLEIYPKKIFQDINLDDKKIAI